MMRYVKASKENAEIGIWWYTDDREVWAKSCLTDDGVPVHMYLQYSNDDNHMNLWSTVVKEHLDGPEANDRINKGYKSFERGRVIFNCATMCYEVTCSEAILHDKQFQQDIIEYFNLSNNRVTFAALSHYHKMSLTGNPTIDEFYYSIE